MENLYTKCCILLGMTIVQKLSWPFEADKIKTDFLEGMRLQMNKKKLVRFDWAMKYILRNKENFDVLEGFLSNLLKEEVKIEKLLESESSPDEQTNKNNAIHFACAYGQGRPMMVEIKSHPKRENLRRIVWGTSKPIADHLRSREPYKDEVKIVSISILHFPISNDSEYIYKGKTEFFGANDQEPLPLYGGPLAAIGVIPVTNMRISLEYYLLDVARFADEINAEIDEWMYFFKHSEIREDFQSLGMLAASKKLDILSMTEEEKHAYEKYLAYLASDE